MVRHILQYEIVCLLHLRCFMSHVQNSPKIMHVSVLWRWMWKIELVKESGNSLRIHWKHTGLVVCDGVVFEVVYGC